MRSKAQRKRPKEISNTFYSEEEMNGKLLKDDQLLIHRHMNFLERFPIRRSQVQSVDLCKYLFGV